MGRGREGKAKGGSVPLALILQFDRCPGFQSG